ncbi:fasciclin domain-containing protein [Psychrobacter sp. APC 3426]|uniref:fasciclin domain-containing protein n=1 Tax=Psychrobacter sp. APC 3426 TaxID=3035177 RepID=UPI0025B2B0EE|nr:fasciclin domain-containing protein [Psychrobacter sp. APC 3426]MDN3399193.1 fasciclin domain-containing protein [Psychrobacter sp. APC 3426]
MEISKLATISTLAISIAGLSACNNMMPVKDTQMKAPTHSQPMAKMNVVQIAQSNSDFSLLVEALQAADLAGALSDTSASYTILAPTNAAFAKALQENGMTKAELFANKPLLTKILTYHVLKGNTSVYQKHVRPGNYTMLSTDTLVITPQGKLKDENGRITNILKTDIAASNGVIHVIDRVLMPK